MRVVARYTDPGPAICRRSVEGGGTEADVPNSPAECDASALTMARRPESREDALAKQAALSETCVKRRKMRERR